MKNGEYSKKRNQRPRIEVPENIVYGRNALRELLAGGRDIDKIYVLDGEFDRSLGSIVSEARERGIPTVKCDRHKLDVMCGGAAHQGIAASVSEKEYSSIDEILEYAAARGEKPFVIIAAGIEDPHNLGAIIRSAECAGAHGVIIPKRRAAGLTAVVSKASAGALEHMRVAKVANIASTVEELKEKGLWIYAADMGGEAYYNTDMTSAMALVLGNEGDGIARNVAEKCDFTVSIPILGHVDSLNVSCAGAVLMCEIARQRAIGAK